MTKSTIMKRAWEIRRKDAEINRIEGGNKMEMNCEKGKKMQEYDLAVSKMCEALLLNNDIDEFEKLLVAHESPPRPGCFLLMAETV